MDSDDDDEQVNIDEKISDKCPFEYTVAELWKDVTVQHSPESDEFHEWWNAL